MSVHYFLNLVRHFHFSWVSITYGAGLNTALTTENVTCNSFS